MTPPFKTTLHQPEGKSQEGSVVFVYLVSTVAAVGGFLFGFDTAVINGALPFLRETFQLTDVQIEIAASSLLLGCVIGVSFAGSLSDRYGRKQNFVSGSRTFLSLRRWSCHSQQPDSIHCRALCWRTRHWRGFDALSPVYRRNRTSRDSGTAGFVKSDGNHHWDYLLLFCELAALRYRCFQLALDVWSGGSPLFAFRAGNFAHAGKSALAGQAGTV